MTNIEAARELARGPHAFKLDVSGGQVLPNKQTTPTKLSISLVSLPHGKLEDMTLASILANRASATPESITQQDFLPNAEQGASIMHQAAIIATKALTEHSEKFKRYNEDPLLQFQKRRPLPEMYRTHIQEVYAVMGQRRVETYAAAVEQTYLTQLGMDRATFADRAIPSINSITTNRMLRRAQRVLMQQQHQAAVNGTPGKVGTGSEALLSLQLAPGLLSVLKHLVKATLKNHLGTLENPGSLASMFKILNKQHLALGKPEDFLALLSFFHTQLTASLLDCWRLNCGKEELEQYADTNPTPDELLELATKILLKQAKPLVLPVAPENSEEEEEEEDTSFENGRILMRDLLYIMILKHAINDADIGRAEDLFRTIAICLMGAGMDNAAEAMMDWIFDVKCTWPEAFANIMRDNMILNLFQSSSNSQPADVSAEFFPPYLKLYFESDEKPKTLAEGIEAVNRFDRLSRRGECPVM